jgi:hypothetical protein
MKQPSMICVFCEDIREEKSGQDTIVGTIPDNLILAGSTLPAIMPRLGFYTRINLSSGETRPKAISAKVLNTNDTLIAQTTWTLEVINKGFEDAEANHLPLVGLIFKLVVRPFPIPENGIVRVIVNVDEEDCLAGILNVTVSNASSQPAEQSPSSAPQS